MKHVIVYHKPEVNPEPVEVRNPGRFSSKKSIGRQLDWGDLIWVFSRDKQSGIFISHYYKYEKMEIDQKADRPFIYRGGPGTVVKKYASDFPLIRIAFKLAGNGGLGPQIVSNSEVLMFLDCLKK